MEQDNTPKDALTPTGTLGRRRWQARDIAPLAGLAVLIVFFSFAAPRFLRPATLVAILKQGSVLAIVAAGLTYVLLCAQIDLSVGMMALWAACFCGWSYEKWALGSEGAASGPMVALVIVLPLVSCLLLGLLCGLLTVWSRLPSFIISLAMMFVAEGLARYLTKSKMSKVPAILDTIGNEGIRLGEHFRLPYSALLAAAVMLAGHVVLQHTRFGRYVYMTGGNREAARLAGVRTGLIVVATLVLCALAAGLGGMANSGRMGHVTLDQNKDLLLSAVACVVLGGTSLFGGKGSMGKTAIGVLTFTVLNVGLIQIDWIDDLARQLLTGVVLMVALVINGLLAKRK
ncbi:MAG: ABC transporter permease [Phycisphaerae bacterium]|nr:ABC transporter permease [Phycisphaerae bacterium]